MLSTEYTIILAVALIFSFFGFCIGFIYGFSKCKKIDDIIISNLKNKYINNYLSF